MNTEFVTFHFKLSPAELHWLAGAFGLAHLPLLDTPVHNLPTSQFKEAELKNGLASLQSRGLISHASVSYQVDRLSAAVIKWLGSAASMLLLDVHTRSRTSHRAQVFSEEDASMYVSLEDEKYQFLFLSGRRAVSDYLLDQVGASFADLKTATAKYALSQPVTILRTAWTDPSLAANMLKVTGLKPKEIKHLLAWAESLEWIVTLNHVQLEVEEIGKERKAILCGNKQGCWSGGIEGKAEDRITLTPISLREAHPLIENLL